MYLCTEIPVGRAAGVRHMVSTDTQATESGGERVSMYFQIASIEVSNGADDNAWMSCVQSIIPGLIEFPTAAK